MNISLGFERAKWFAKILDFATYLVHMSLLSTKAFHLGLDLLRRTNVEFLTHCINSISLSRRASIWGVEEISSLGLKGVALTSLQHSFSRLATSCLLSAFSIDDLEDVAGSLLLAAKT
jgi:hypothetical protein